jgi:hypothetical protein
VVIGFPQGFWEAWQRSKVNGSRVLFISLLMLTALWVKPISAQVGSTLTDSAPAANVSTDWTKKDVKVPNVVGLWRDEAILDLFKAELRIGNVREETSTSVAHPLIIVGSPFRWYRIALIQRGYV